MTDRAGIDEQIKRAQRKGAGIYVLGAVATLLVVGSVLFWLFLVKGYSLIIGPDEASDNAHVSVRSGIAWASNSQIFIVGSEASIDVSAATFETSSLTINDSSPSTIEVILEPSPAHVLAELDIAGETSWYINNELVQVGKDLDYKIAPGEYELSVENPYFMPWTTNFVAERAKTIRLMPQLQSIKGSIAVNSEPLGAAISITPVTSASQNSQEIKASTPSFADLFGGEYQLTLNLKDYESVTERFEITEARPDLTRNYQLKPVQAFLDITAKPDSGVLLINNIEKSYGQHSVDAKRSHLIEYRLPGYFPYTENVVLAPGENKQINIALKPELGEVEINVNTSADLSIDGKSFGIVGPETHTLSLPAKSTQLQFSKAGFRSVTQSIQPTSARKLNVAVNLLSEFDARRAEGRPLVATQLGINLLKFSPDAYVMGSPPNETGRRRNEHQVSVDFSRDFWVSAHEITEAQFATFEGKSSNSALPKTNVTWEQAALFCNWLSEQEALLPFYIVQQGRVVGYDRSSRGYRLPTEAEWEWLAKKARRARSTVYVWGDQTRIPTNAGNFADQSSKELIKLDNYDDKQAGVAEVGSFKADRLGLYDLAGNVSEWVNDYYTTALPDMVNTQTDYMGAIRGSQYVVKGGNYTSGRLRELRAAYREVGESAKPTIGFRIARYD